MIIHQELLNLRSLNGLGFVVDLSSPYEIINDQTNSSFRIFLHRPILTHHFVAIFGAMLINLNISILIL